MDKTTKFLVYCIEIYKTKHKINGKEIIQIFDKYGVFDYIVECYGALHTTGPEYIIDDITSFIKEKSETPAY
jgi:DNA modification methylase